MRTLYAVTFVILLFLLSRVFAESENSSGSIACLQNPIALPAAGLKYETTVKITKNGQPLATEEYDFELKPTTEPDRAEDSLIALLVPGLFTRHRDDLNTLDALSAQACVIHIEQSLIQSEPGVSMDVGHQPAPLSIDQRQANDLVVGLLLFRLETYPATQPASAEDAAPALPVFAAKSVSPDVRLSGAAVLKIADGVISLQFKDIGNGGSVTITKAEAAEMGVNAADFNQPPLTGSCDVDATTGWISSATVEQSMTIGGDKYSTQISVHAVKEFIAAK